jgi:glutaredoxin
MSFTTHARCEIHDLAAGPDGHCVLCRRAAAAPPKTASDRWVRGAVVALLVCIACAMLWKGVQGAGRAVARMHTDHAAGAPANPVRLYTTSWCPHCKRAKTWLDNQHVDYVELDVESNSWARTEQLRLNRRGSIPTFDAYGEVVVGFDPQSYEAALQRGAQRQQQQAQ